MSLARGTRGRAACRFLVALSLFGGAGCLRFFNPIREPLPMIQEAFLEAPASSKKHVYIFFVHGLDPLDSANFFGVNNYVRQLGFEKVYYGHLYHASYFKKEIDRIHQDDSMAHFVLIGFSFGANVVRSLANDMKEHDIPVDLLVYLGGNTLENIPEDRPANAQRIVNILASGCIWNGAWLDGAENIHETDVWHFGTPSHPRTLAVLARQLSDVAASFAIDDEVPAQPESTGGAQIPLKAAKRDEWDFLKPMQQLEVHVKPSEASAKQKPGDKEHVMKEP